MIENKKGLSVLIPVYNYRVNDLVMELINQAQALNIPFEIRCYDDCSTDKSTIKSNTAFCKNLKNTTYLVLPNNLGRSKIRNKLAEDSIFSSILFIDCDSKINNPEYLQNYVIQAFTSDVIFGGTEYARELENPEFSLRWKYGKKREERDALSRNQKPYESITFNNIFIQRDLFLENKLDEKISSYGHEDTKFGYEMKTKNIPISHISNPVEHIGLESNEHYLNKTAEGVKNFYIITSQNMGTDTKLFRSFNFLKKLALTGLFKGFYSLFSKRIDNNLKSDNPTLLYFDLYKLNLIIEEDKKAKKKVA